MDDAGQSYFYRVFIFFVKEITGELTKLLE
jgi:hypothetical protein